MNVAEYLRVQGAPHRALPHPPCCGAQRLAHLLHTPGGRVAKCVLLRADGGFAYVLAVLPADKRIDLAALAKVLGGSRLELASETELSECCPDCEPGALPPFGDRYGVKTVMDESLAAADEIVFEANTHAEAIGMPFAEYRRLAEPLTARFAV